ncbi:hypothetical protein G6F42_011388 [Rhizopus arrhizus]|nr:hypothetical protein G6F42_011388 [Rhizopus arrhizus]
MFSNTIVFGTNEKVLALHGQLFSDPAKGKLVQHIYFKENFDAFWVAKAVLKTEFLPNVNSFQGSVSKPEEFYEMLLSIAHESPNVLKKLKALPSYKGHINTTYYSVLLTFKETLAEIHINNQGEFMNEATIEFTRNLNIFPNLKSLRLDANFRKLSELELFLKGCTRLEKLELGNTLPVPTLSSITSDAWMVHNVTRVGSLEQLTIERECRPELIEYLTYKYPNIKELTISLGYNSLNIRDITVFTCSMDRILRAIEGIETKEFEFWLQFDYKSTEVVDYFLKKGYSLKIEDTQDDDKLFIVMEML